VQNVREVAIVGIGHGKFGKREDASLRELAFEGVKGALEDVGITLKDVDSMVTGIGFEEFTLSTQPSAEVVDYIGFNPKGDFRAEAACASGSAALRAGWMTIASGLADVVLVVGVEKMCDCATGVATDIMGRAGDAIWEYPFGATFPGYYALIATMHMTKYGTTEEQLAMVAVKNHHYGALNPLAHMQKEISIEKALSSFVVAHPLKLFDCCLISDGGAAVILASKDRAKKMTDTPIWITGLGCGTSTGMTSERKDMTTIEGTVTAAHQAYKQAGLDPKDVDVACVHDCFTIAEIVAYEDLGFCNKGDGGKLIEEKQTYIGGKIPVNVDGGLKAKGHPLGATGVSMAVEMAKQLRGEAGSRQVNGAEVGLTQNVGGNGQHVLVHIFRR